MATPTSIAGALKKSELVVGKKKKGERKTKANMVSKNQSRKFHNGGLAASVEGSQIVLDTKMLAGEYFSEQQLSPKMSAHL